MTSNSCGQLRDNIAACESPPLTGEPATHSWPRKTFGTGPKLREHWPRAQRRRSQRLTRRWLGWTSRRCCCSPGSGWGRWASPTARHPQSCEQEKPRRGRGRGQEKVVVSGCTSIERMPPARSPTRSWGYRRTGWTRVQLRSFIVPSSSVLSTTPVIRCVGSPVNHHFPEDLGDDPRR